MAELIAFETRRLPPFRVVGKALTVRPQGPNPIPGFWQQCFSDDTFPRLEEMKEHLCQEILLDAPDAYIGWMGEMKEDGSFTCLVGMLMKPGTLPPQGFSFRDVPGCETALGQIKGKEPEIYAAENDLLLPELERLGRTPGSFCMEVYACPRFTIPDSEGNVVLDYYMELKPGD